MYFYVSSHFRVIDGRFTLPAKFGLRVETIFLPTLIAAGWTDENTEYTVSPQPFFVQFWRLNDTKRFVDVTRLRRPENK